MSSVKTQTGLSLGLCVGLLFVGLTSVSAQAQSVELPKRVAAPFMSYQGAGWLERPERVAEEMPDAMVAVMGLSHKNDNDPSEIIMALRRFSSSIPPKIKPSNNGASG